MSIRAQKKISDQLSVIVGMMTPSQILQDESSGIVPALEFARSVHPDLKQAQTSKVAVGRLPAGWPRLMDNSLGHRSDFVRSPFPIVNKHQCKAFCSCVCHARTIVRSPWLLDTVIGKIHIQYASRRPACNEHNCRRSSESSFSVVYQLPKYILRRYISMTIQYVPLGGPELLLRIPRMVSWSHLLWNYATHGDLLAIQKLFAKGKASPHDLNPQGSNALIYAVGHSSPGLMRFLLEQGADLEHPNEIGKTPSDRLLESSFAGTFGSKGIVVVGSMLKDTLHMQTQGFTTLHKIVLGIVSKDLESELKMSTAEINVGDSRNRTPLCWATIRSDVQAVKTLLVYGASPHVVDRWGHTPLDFARNIGICKLLLDAGVNVHACNKDYGRSALHQLFHIHDNALGSETVDMINVLIGAGIDVDVRDSDEETPLLNAIYAGHISHARRLIELGASVNASNLSSRESAIHFAVGFDRHEVIPLLLQRGADYTAINASGNNIAHIAARSAGTKTISVLADSNLIKLDTSLRNRDGKTPADYLSDRSILIESEQGLHAEFERFRRSISVSGAGTADGISKADLVHELSEGFGTFHLPGAFPVFADPSDSS